MPVTDLDVWRCARLFIAQHAEHAEWDAGARAEEMQARGDLAGEAVWKRVQRAIRELQRIVPPDGELIN